LIIGLMALVLPSRRFRPVRNRDCWTARLSGPMRSPMFTIFWQALAGAARLARRRLILCSFARGLASNNHEILGPFNAPRRIGSRNGLGRGAPSPDVRRRTPRPCPEMPNHTPCIALTSWPRPWRSVERVESVLVRALRSRACTLPGWPMLSMSPVSEAQPPRPIIGAGQSCSAPPPPMQGVWRVVARGHCSW